MKIIYNLIKLVVFLVLILLAITNTQIVDFNYLPGQTIQLPLIVLLLLFFIVGAVCGIFAMFGRLLKLRSEVNRWRGEVKKTTAMVKTNSSNAVSADKSQLGAE